MAVATLPAAPTNAKDHDGPAQAASVTRFGFIEPIVLDERTGSIISGHGRQADLVRRMEAGESPPDGVELAADGVWMVPVVRGWHSRDDADAKAAGVALNRVGERGGWKLDVLAETLQFLADTDTGLDGTGYNADELDDVLAALGAGELDNQGTDAAHAPRPGRGDAATPREVQGLREVGLMFKDADHREYVEHLAKLKRAWDTDVAPLVVLRAMREAAASA